MVSFINEEWIPLAVSLGIPCQTFYSLTPKKLLRYMPFYVKSMKREKQMIDEQAWLTNMYTQVAIGSSFSKHGKYPNTPLDVYGVVPKPKLPEDDEPDDVINFRSWARAFNKQREQKESEVT